MKTIYNWFLAVSLLLSTSTAFSQGVTTSAVNGQITDAVGEPLPGANVVIKHLPSGTVYGSTTDFDGFYRISGMRPGGPYKVTISYIGFEDVVKENEYLQLGQTSRYSAQLSESVTALEGVVLTGTGNGIFNSNKTGSETTVNQRSIQTLPAASRSIADFVRVTPQASLTEGDDGFSISLGGQNNRYNAIYIDGAVNNDVFGLAGSGTNGGQTGVNPFSVDAIESFQIALAPFDVRIAGFSGGAISAITRSGTNKLEGSVYYFLRNQNLSGKTPTDLVPSGESAQKLAEFTAQTYGFRIGGPLVKDKLFFFLNYERQDDETPQPFNVNNYIGATDAAGLRELSEFIRDTYDYTIGGFENNTRTLSSDKITLKMDWNADDNNKLSLRHSYVRGNNLEARSSDFNDIGFINGSESFLTTTNSTSLEWNGSFGNKYGNSLIIGYTSVRDDRDPSGSPFPTVRLRDGDGTISFGSERFSTANLLNQDVFTLTNNFEIYSGRHTITLGTHNEYAKVKNLFFASNYGFYTFNNVFDDMGNLIETGVDRFRAMQAPDDYERGYSLVGGNAVGDNSDGASEFDIFQFGFYVQDEIQMSENFKLTAGLRLDMPFWSDGPVNEDFNTNTIPILEAAGKDLQDARVGQGVATTAYISPRVGFNWDVNGNRSTQIRGGVGIFTSRLPLVWPGATYNNNGITGGFANEANTVVNGFNPDVSSQPVNVAPGTGGTGGNVDLFAKDFKLPQVFKWNLAIDQKLPWWGLVASLEGIFNDNINAIYYENLNLGDPVGNLNGADDRSYYDRFTRLDPNYLGVYLASNTKEGYSYNLSFTLRKPFRNGFAGSLSYSYGDAYAIFDGTSSQNSSQWRNIQTVNGKNSNLPVTRSDFSQGHRFIGNVSYEYKWNDNLKTTIGLFYEGSQSQPVTYVYNEQAVDLLNDDSRDNALIYVPADLSEINLVDIEGGLTAAQQWDALDAYIRGNDYLNSRRGQYAERNGDRGPWSHIVDLKFLQDFSLNFNKTKHTFQLSLDIFNFTNLLNKNWGNKNLVDNFGEVALINTVTGAPDPAFNFNPTIIDRIVQPDDEGIQSSRWQMQFGLRYIFN